MLWQSLHGPYCGAPEDPLFRYMTFHQKKRNQRGIVSLLRKRNSSPRISFTRCSRTDDAVDSEGFSNLYPVCFAVEIILPWSVQFESSPPPSEPPSAFAFFFFLFLGKGAQRSFIDTPVHGIHPRKSFPQPSAKRTISFPLFSAAFHQLILESLQVFHNSNGIFGLVPSPLRRRYKRRFAYL